MLQAPASPRRRLCKSATPQVNGDPWSLWTAEQACGSLSRAGVRACKLHLSHVQPGPLRLSVFLQHQRGPLSEGHVFLVADAAAHRAALFERNPWMVDPEWQPAPPADLTTNLALGGRAEQHSTAYGAAAARAVDGSTDGDFASGSCTHTVPAPAPAPARRAPLRSARARAA